MIADDLATAFAFVQAATIAHPRPPTDDRSDVAGRRYPVLSRPVAVRVAHCSILFLAGSSHLATRGPAKSGGWGLPAPDRAVRSQCPRFGHVLHTGDAQGDGAETGRIEVGELVPGI